MRQIGRPQARGERENRPQVPFREDGMLLIRRYVIGLGAGLVGGVAIGWALGNYGAGLAVGVGSSIFICALRGGRPPRA
jgi:hypothetical protein